MVHPNVRVVGIHRDAVVHAPHDGKIAEFNAFRIAHQEAETVNSGIGANTLDGDVEFGVGTFAFNLNTFLAASKRVDIGCFHHSHHSNDKWGSDIILLIGGKNGLQTREFSVAELRLYSLGIAGSDIDNLCSSFQSAVTTVGTRFIAVFESKSLAFISLNLQSVDLISSIFLLLFVNHRNYLQGVCARFQSNNVSTSVGAVVAHELMVDFCEIVICTALHINIVRSGSTKQVERHIS